MKQYLKHLEHTFCSKVTSIFHLPYNFYLVMERIWWEMKLSVLFLNLHFAKTHFYEEALLH